MGSYLRTRFKKLIGPGNKLDFVKQYMNFQKAPISVEFLTNRRREELIFLYLVDIK